MNIPIIRLEIEGMKRTLMRALPEHAAEMDASVQAAVEAYCTPENIGAIIEKAVKDALDAAVKEEVRTFFQWSNPGRLAVREAVIKHLDEWERIHSQ